MKNIFQSKNPKGIVLREEGAYAFVDVDAEEESLLIEKNEGADCFMDFEKTIGLEDLGFSLDNSSIIFMAIMYGAIILIL
jgi:hypothetical protein